MAKQKQLKAAVVKQGRRKLPISAEQQRANSIAELLGPGASGAANLGKEVFAPESLGRVEQGRAQETQDLLNQQRALAAFYGPGGQQRSAEVQDLLARQKAGLEGYSAPEVTAMREQASREADRAYQANLRQLATQQARSGVRGASAAAQLANLGTARQKEAMQLEQDLMLQNIGEKSRRLSEYGQNLRGVEDTEFNKGQQALGTYSQGLGAAQQNELARQQYNQGQLAAEKSGYLNTLYGGTDLYNQRRAADRNYKLGRQMTSIAKQQLRRGGGGGPNYQGYANELAGLL